MPLTQYFRELIAIDGPITVARYMRDALLHPEFGYYTARDPFGDQTGDGGDFITAPEISQMFGELIGLWAAQCWQQMAEPDRVVVAELGPGRGFLSADFLRAAKMVPPFEAAIELHLVEASDKMRRLQRQQLSGQEVIWHDAVDDLPAGPTIIIANEFFDALPIRQFEFRGGGWHERMIDWRDDKLAFALSSGEVLPPRPPARPRDGDVVEYSQERDWAAQAIGRQLAKGGGYALIIDYGFVDAGYGDTLQALRDHQFVGIFDAPGMADLTSHVDFTRLAATSGAKAWQPVTQGDFLRRLGIETRAAMLAQGEQAGPVERALRRLTDNDQMGQLFKVLALASPGLETPAGFEIE